MARTVAAFALSAMISTPALADQDTSAPPVSEQAPEVRLTGEVVTLPIVMVREYPFIEASIAGVAGKLMLDTGYRGALVVNDHRVPVAGGRTIGSGFFGSGQTFEVRLMPEVLDVRIGGLAYPRVTEVRTQDARLLESITPDFLGWFGFEAFGTHALKLDYRALQASFYAEGGDYLAGERIVADLPFEIRRLPNMPLMTGGLSDMRIVVSWDTGQYGALYTTEAGKARLLSEGILTPSATDPDAFDVHGLDINGHRLPVIPAVEVRTEPSPASGSIGITEADHMTLGYGLLQQFKTVWDFPQGRIILLEP
ncbi:hypothetical protein [Brevundimonas sp.]|jgi:hypothetical protein|uniref:hypothetical protein n=1 Tax=Brevundimonas sp. TaxID=1871086 RepID=UPI0037C1786D